MKRIYVDEAVFGHEQPGTLTGEQVNDLVEVNLDNAGKVWVRETETRPMAMTPSIEVDAEEYLSATDAALAHVEWLRTTSEVCVDVLGEDGVTYGVKVTEVDGITTAQITRAFKKGKPRPDLITPVP